jgi:RES domain-containing protein
MELFRITAKEYAQELYAPGFAGRWNLDGQKVIYTASSRSLACLEIIVQANRKIKTTLFGTMVVYVPDNASVQQVNLSQLSSDWNQTVLSGDCKIIGSEWFINKKTLLLRVPSAVIPDEYNYVINTQHPQFKLVKLIDVLPFYFDKRLG